ncbi:MAG: 16S rRNA (guanine(966)-N(2))-methyltransferase RsmD [Pyrinomonadaceae bacterium]
MMRIIGGKLKGRRLKSPPDLKTRPTSDRLRETLFNVLQTTLSANTRFLDLCAGTGAVGIEAFSRGAEFVTFVDSVWKCCSLIEENLDAMGIPEPATEVIRSDALKFVKQDPIEAWGIVYFDPPYSTAYSEVLSIIGEEAGRIVVPDGVVIAEHASLNGLPDEAGKLRRWRKLKQGDSSLSFYRFS